MGVNNIDFDLMEKALTDLNNEISVDKELADISDVKFELESISSQHGNYMSGLLDQLDPCGSGLTSAFRGANERYNGLVHSLEVGVSYRGVDDDGAVSSPSTGSPSGGTGAMGTASGGIGGSSGSSGSSGRSSGGTGSSTPPVDSNAGKIGVQTGTAGVTKEQLDTISDAKPSITTGAVVSNTVMDGHGSTGGSSGGVSGVATDVGGLGSAGSPAGATAGAVASSGAAVGGVVTGVVGGGTGVSENVRSTEVDYPSGNYPVDKELESYFTEEEKEKITEMLKESGYTPEEIEAIFNGEYGSSQVLVDAMSTELSVLSQNDPSVREALINQYGFDIFNEDGSINNNKLSLALFMDDADYKDSYSMIQMLSQQYGVNLVDQELLTDYSSRLGELLLRDYSIKDKIISQYGFDVFNNDGTINQDRLTLAMLIDSKNNNGESLLSIMNKSTSSDITSYLDTNIKEIDSISDKKSKGGMDNMTPIAAVLAAGGAAAGIGIVAHNSKVAKEEKKKEAEEKLVEEKKEEKVDPKKDGDWLIRMIRESE